MGYIVVTNGFLPVIVCGENCSCKNVIGQCADIMQRETSSYIPRGNLINVIESEDGKYVICTEEDCKGVVGALIEEKTFVLLYSFRQCYLEHVVTNLKAVNKGVFEISHINRVCEICPDGSLLPSPIYFNEPDVNDVDLDMVVADLIDMDKDLNDVELQPMDGIQSENENIDQLVSDTLSEQFCLGMELLEEINFKAQDLFDLIDLM